MMKCDPRAVFAALALVLASCQGSGLDSGGMGDMAPPVSQPGNIGAGGVGGMNNGMNNNNMSGPSVGANGQEELTNPGATMAANEVQYPITQGPSGMKCPTVLAYNLQYGCNVAFNMPPPTPTPGPGASPKPTATPTPTPQPTSSSDDSDDSDDTPTPSPGPNGMMTMQVEPFPKDVPSMTKPDPLYMHITPLMAIRLQSNTDFALNGGTSVQFTLPATQFAGRVFAVQLYNETSLRGKRTDMLLGSFEKSTTPLSNTVQFTFNVPKVTVRHTQIWLLAMYGAQLPPNTTPTPSPTPASTTSPTPSPSHS